MPSDISYSVYINGSNNDTNVVTNSASGTITDGDGSKGDTGIQGIQGLPGLDANMALVNANTSGLATGRIPKMGT